MHVGAVVQSGCHSDFRRHAVASADGAQTAREDELAQFLVTCSVRSIHAGRAVPALHIREQQSTFG
jgi:hypothetical protein